MNQFDFCYLIHLSSTLWCEQSLCKKQLGLDPSHQEWRFGCHSLRWSGVFVIFFFFFQRIKIFIICLDFSVYEYGSLQSNRIFKLLGKRVLYFHDIIQIDSTATRPWTHQSYNLISNSISKNVIHETVFKACTFYFFRKWFLFSKHSAQYRISFLHVTHVTEIRTVLATLAS